MINDIIRHCPLLENISLSAILLQHCKEPLMQALECRSKVKDFEILKVAPVGESCLTWHYDEIITRLFTRWDSLESLLLVALSGRPRKDMQAVINKLPTFRCTLTSLWLSYPDLAGPELEALLQGSRNTLKTLQLKMPSTKLDRREMFRVLKDCTGPELESLTLIISPDWHPVVPKKPVSRITSTIITDPAKSPFMIDTLLNAKAFPSLKQLNIVGPLASSNFLPVLPESIVKLAWDGCLHIHPQSLVEFLSAWRTKASSNLFDNDSQAPERTRHLPSLTCCSVGSDDLHCQSMWTWGLKWIWSQS